jgi:hypothetical protein
VRRDDSEVADSETLFRRIHPSQLIWDENVRDWGISSAGWDDVTGDISVYIASMLADRHLDPARVLDGYPQHSLVSVTAADVRGLDEPFGVIVDPDKDDEHPRGPCHALVTGLLPGNPGRKKQQRPLARKSKIEILRPKPLI